jgi:hypothetical protein
MSAGAPLPDENRVSIEARRRDQHVNWDRYLSLLLAVCCVGAAGVASTTLDSTFEQRPDDVVDLDYEELPIGSDQAATLKEAIKGTAGDESGTDPAAAGDPGAAAEDSPDRGDRTSDSESGDGAGGDASTGSGPDQSGVSSGSGDRQTGDSASAGELLAGTGGTGPGENPPGPSLLDRLLNLLPLLVLVLVLVLAYRYRATLAALITGAFDRVEPSTDGSAARVDWPSGQPENQVHAAWLRMVSRAGVEAPRRRTPSECAAAAVDAGLDPDGVGTLTAVFEEVRYGEAPVTEERIERAREGLRRLDARVDGGERGHRTGDVEGRGR